MRAEQRCSQQARLGCNSRLSKLVVGGKTFQDKNEFLMQAKIEPWGVLIDNKLGLMDDERIDFWKAREDFLERCVLHVQC